MEFVQLAFTSRGSLIKMGRKAAIVRNEISLAVVQTDFF